MRSLAVLCALVAAIVALAAWLIVCHGAIRWEQVTVLALLVVMVLGLLFLWQGKPDPLPPRGQGQVQAIEIEAESDDSNPQILPSSLPARKKSG